MHFLNSDPKESRMVMDLKHDTKELQVLVKIQKLRHNSNETIVWCDDVKVFIIYGEDSEYLQSKSDMKHFDRNICCL